MRYSLGKVSYVNVLPLFSTDADGGFDLFSKSPSELNELAHSNSLDATMISRWVYKSISKDYAVLPRFGIFGDGEIMSVKLFSKRPIQDLKNGSIFITPETGTSSRAFSYLIKQKWEFDIFDIPRKEIKTADAVLLIGNSALVFDASGYPYSVDLGEMWKCQIGLNMMYSVFVIKRELYDKIAPHLTRFLENNLEYFKKNRTLVIENAHSSLVKSSGVNIDIGVLEKYYNCLKFELSDTDFTQTFDFIEKNGCI